MTGTVYALLAGIDRYPSPTPTLRGCKNDIAAIHQLLTLRVGNRLQARVLHDSPDDTASLATRANLIAGFREHLCQAGPDDVALFYFSGHGSQEQAPQAFWRLEPDRLNETLVCYDSRSEGGWDLADKELAQLIAEVAKRQPHIVVVLDCCHSGSGTRDDDDIGLRRTLTDERARPLDAYTVLSAEQLAALTEQSHSKPPAGDWFDLPQGQHIVLSACRPEEVAKERQFDGQHHGALSYALLECLKQGYVPTYRDLFRVVNAHVRSIVAQQSPQLDATDTTDLDRPFLGGIAQSQHDFFVSHDDNLGWIIDGGAVHGFTAGEGDERTILALFPFDAPLPTPLLQKHAVGTATIRRVLPGQSQVDIRLDNQSEHNHGQRFRAIIAALPLRRLTVKLAGDPQAQASVRSALASAGFDQQPSQLVREAGADEGDVDLIVDAADERYRIRRTGDAYPLVVDIAGFSPKHAALAIQRLEHIGRWMNIARLSNPISRLPPEAVQMEIYAVDPGTGREQGLPLDLASIPLTYTRRGEQWETPKIKIKLQNTTDRELHCILLDLTDRYKVDAGLLPEGRVRLAPKGRPGDTLWAYNDKPIPVYIPKELRAQGAVAYHDLLKLIVSTSDADGRLLQQGNLDAAYVRDGERGGIPRSTLSRLMRRVDQRDTGEEPGQGEILDDWVSRQVLCTVVHPADDIALPDTGKPADLGMGVVVQGHPLLRGRARLATEPEVGRELGSVTLPPLLRDHPELSQPLTFAPSRGGEPGLSVLELTDVKNAAAVQPDQPLVVTVDAALAQGEHVLPLGFDGEFYLPLGYAQRIDNTPGTQIVIERLPAPTSGSNRDLTGSIKIMFRKIVSERLGRAFDGTRLAIPEVSPQGEVTYRADRAEIRSRAAAAQRVLLYMHGIIGDTRGMAQSALRRLDDDTPPLAERFDLVLTFDYENINTPIDETARALKAKLDDVGLTAEHGKKLHIVAHSMGGLVARYFIEHEGGNQVVKHLVMLGTPNAGSPWPTVQAWATTLVGIGLNFAESVAWPLKALGWLVGAIETVDETLDQMQFNSPFLRQLAAAPDPQVAYTILAGNTSLLQQVAEHHGAAGRAAVERLIGRLAPQRLLHDLTALAFFGDPNDVAVSVESISSVPQGRDPQPQPATVACDHMTYFSTPAALGALTAALAQADE